MSTATLVTYIGTCAPPVADLDSAPGRKDQILAVRERIIELYEDAKKENSFYPLDTDEGEQILPEFKNNPHIFDNLFSDEQSTLALRAAGIIIYACIDLSDAEQCKQVVKTVFSQLRDSDPLRENGLYVSIKTFLENYVPKPLVIQALQLDPTYNKSRQIQDFLLSIPEVLQQKFDKYGTALHWAAANFSFWADKKERYIQILLNKNINVFAKNKDNKTALQVLKTEFLASKKELEMTKEKLQNATTNLDDEEERMERYGSVHLEYYTKLLRTIEDCENSITRQKKIIESIKRCGRLIQNRITTDLAVQTFTTKEQSDFPQELVDNINKFTIQ